MVKSIVGTGTEGYKDDVGGKAEFNFPCGIIISQDGKSLIFVDFGNECIRKVSVLNGMTSTIAGMPCMMGIDLSASSSSPKKKETLYWISIFILTMKKTQEKVNTKTDHF